MKAVPEFWASGTRIDAESKQRMQLLREAGCECDLPLLGEIPDVGPRCRLCMTQAQWCTCDRGRET